MKQQTAALAALLALTGIAHAQINFVYAERDTVLALDFTSDGSGDATAYNGVNPPLGTGADHVAFAVAELGPSASTSTNPSITVNDISFALTGNVSAWPGDNGANILTGDYLFMPSTDGRLGANKTLQWSVSGLIANRDYTFTFTPGMKVNRGFTVTSGAESLVVSGGAGDRSIVLTADSSGIVSGSVTGTGNEGNLAGLRVADDVTIPPSAGETPEEILANKGFSTAWIDSLKQPDSERWYSGSELNYIGQTVGGLFAG